MKTSVHYFAVVRHTFVAILDIYYGLGFVHTYEIGMIIFLLSLIGKQKPEGSFVADLAFCLDELCPSNVLQYFI